MSEAQSIHFNKTYTRKYQVCRIKLMTFLSGIAARQQPHRAKSYQQRSVLSMRQRNSFFCFLWSIKIEHNIQTRVRFNQHQREGIGHRVLHHWVQRTTRDCVLSKLLYFLLHHFFLTITQLISLRMKQRRLKSL